MKRKNFEEFLKALQSKFLMEILATILIFLNRNLKAFLRFFCVDILKEFLVATQMSFNLDFLKNFEGLFLRQSKGLITWIF